MTPPPFFYRFTSLSQTDLEGKRGRLITRLWIVGYCALTLSMQYLLVFAAMLTTTPLRVNIDKKFYMPMGSTLEASIQTDTTHYVEYALNRKRLALAEDIIMKYA